MRVLVAEDQALLREGLSRLLGECGVDVVATAGTLDDALRRARGHKPDAVLSDLRMPPDHQEEGLKIAAALADSEPPCGVLIFSQYAEPEIAGNLLERRTTGVGYLLKDRIGDISTLVDALRRVVAGGTVVDPALVAPLVSRRADEPLHDLSPREREILSLMAEGHSNRAIGERLHLSPKTVESHVRSIFLKLDLPPSESDSRRVRAVLAWLRRQPNPSSPASRPGRSQG
jgi:DNA-binding NarL/FixJ family response regulator